MKPPSHTRAALLLLVLPLGWSVEAAPGGGVQQVKAEAVCHPAEPGKTFVSYRIQPRNPTADPACLRYAEAARHLRAALSGHGLFEAPAQLPADLIVELDYGVERAQLKYVAVTVTVFHPPEMPTVRPATPFAALVGPGGAGPLGGGNPADEPPPAPTVSYQRVASPVLVWEKYLSVSVRENRPASEGRAPAELWRINVSLEHDNQDLRRWLPVLAAVVMEQFGRDTQGMTTVAIGENDPAVTFVRRGP